MPAISAPATVLVTGANGYIAIYVVKYLLERGFTVRGTVRSPSKGEFLKKKFEAFGNKFEYVIVDDFVKPGAFDEALQGVDAIQHIGAPLPQDVKDVNEIVKPTVDGVLNLLESARKAGTVKRVIVDSTGFAVLQPHDGFKNYTEEDWNDAVVEMLYKDGIKTPSPYIYAASKVLAEKTVFDYAKKNKDIINFDVSTILPVYVFGPPIQEVKNVEEVQFGSTEVMYNGLTQNGKDKSWVDPTTVVDVRDVAEIHILMMTTEAAGNQRILAHAGAFNWQDGYDALNAVVPKLEGVPVGTPGTGKDVKYPFTVDNSKSRELLGFKYRSLDETVTDSWLQFVNRGWINPKSTTA